MKKNEIKDFESLLESNYGIRGTLAREEWEREFEVFKLGVLIEEARKERKMTQEQLAAKCGTNKSYISRIENDASDLRVSTLIKIVNDGLNGRLKLTLD
jgi:DNA-binding XRE family transcriptional regulator